VPGTSGTGATITIDVTGDITLNGLGSSGAVISSDQPRGACDAPANHPGDINLMARGNISVREGAQVSSVGRCPGGAITIDAGVAATIDGTVVSQGTSTQGRGGPITVRGCQLAVGDKGKVVSEGRDPGADLVHLEGKCEVVIRGLVASTGPGHLKPLRNLCQGMNRPDKPAAAGACVEIWWGGPLTIERTTPHNGEVNADTGNNGGVKCCAWIDLIARGPITIAGAASGPFSVHANQTLPSGYGGWITVKSMEDSVSARGLAIQASDAKPGGDGGQVVIEAAGDVTLDEAQVVAQGDSTATNGFGVGGRVEVRAFSGDVSWKNLTGGTTAVGNVQATGSGVPVAQSGTIMLKSCGPIDTTGTSFPVSLGSPTTPTPTTGLCSPDSPDLPDYVVLPTCSCGAGNPDVSVAKSTTTPTISAGGTASYAITVAAGGTGTSTNVRLTDVLPGPASMSWAVSGADAGACSPKPVMGGSTLTCLFGDMAPNATKTIALAATTSAANCPSIANTATVSADGDSNTGNNSSGPVSIAVNCAPDVTISKSTTTPSISAGGTASYSVTVTAGGTGSSSNVRLTDVLPGPASMSWSVTGGGSAFCSPKPVAGGGTLTCNFGTMAAGATKTVTISTTVTAASGLQAATSGSVHTETGGSTDGSCGRSGRRKPWLSPIRPCLRVGRCGSRVPGSAPW
jgi:uncharacterized repeat protein (TIGR01451 family)